jgi:hypothetical protein
MVTLGCPFGSPLVAWLVLSLLLELKKVDSVSKARYSTCIVGLRKSRLRGSCRSIPKTLACDSNQGGFKEQV